MIKCELCGKEYVFINNKHLNKQHGTTPVKYKEQFPNAKLYDENAIKYITETRYHEDGIRPICAKPGCDKLVKLKNNRYCSNKCAMGHRMSALGRNEQAGNANGKKHGHYTIERVAKEAAKERDNYTCKECGKTHLAKSGHVHHIVPKRCFQANPNEAHKLENLITLCGSCHKTLEWAMYNELLDRAIRLDEIIKNNPGLLPGHVPLLDLKTEMYGKKR